MENPLPPAYPDYVYYAPDFLHPTSLGFHVMANSVPLRALPPPQGSCRR